MHFLTRLRDLKPRYLSYNIQSIVLNPENYIENHQKPHLLSMIHFNFSDNFSDTATPGGKIWN
jgi:hypothetical protein